MHEEIEQPSEGEQSSLTGDLGSATTRPLEPHEVQPEPRVSRVMEALLPSSARRQRLGHYVVLGKLGSGGMGTVLEAFDRRLDRRVALKLLHRGLDGAHTKWLLREARALAKLSHPNVVQVYEVGEAEGQTFIAMELVQGSSLRAWLSRQPRPSWKEHVEVYLQAGEGLAAAHARGLVHRDFKPSNVVIDDAGRVRVLDFGLARRVEAAAIAASVELSVEDAALEQDPTQAGEVQGTLGYMAPEQMRGQEVDARSDQFAYCVALWEALYDERPFAGRSLAALQASVAMGDVRPPTRGTDVPAVLRAMLLRGLSADPGERWPSMAVLLVELRRLVSPRGRRWLLPSVAGGLAALGLGFGLGLGRNAAVEDPCQGARAQLQGIWDEAREQELEAAILGTKLAYAADTWERVRARLDAYADAWALRHTEVCAATSIRKEQSTEVMDLRIGCLRERRLALQEAVNVLARADPTRVEHAMALVSDLPGLPRCDDMEALRAELPPPEDPAVAARVEALRQQLAQARALHGAGAYAEAAEAVEAVVVEAEPLSYAPLLAEALLVRGLVWNDMARYSEAARDLEAAYVLAAEHRHHEVEAEAVAELAWVVGHNQARLEAGLQWGTTALALARGLRGEPKAEAFALNVVGGLLSSQGKYEEALATYERALAKWEAAVGPDQPGVATLHNNIGSVLMRQGKLPAALDHLQRAVAIRERALGPAHPELAGSLNNLGTVLKQQGELDEALRSYERALVIEEQALGPAHPDVAISLDSIGLMLYDEGRLDEALPYHERALAIRERALGPHHPDVAISLNNLGNVLGDQGKHEEALASYRRALAIGEQTLGTEHPDIGVTIHNIGAVLADQGKPEAARSQYERALAIEERALGPSHPDLADSLVSMAEIALEMHDHEAAREHAERALSILESSETSPEVLAEARLALAQALGPDRSQRVRARTLAQRARDDYAALREPEPETLAEIDTWLAEHPLP
jgi:tetratricopeptide (TPR) repeat protein/tRNA A-37 threonylcarbamoyl transferase component Bud32